jgi:hypothetical protein
LTVIMEGGLYPEGPTDGAGLCTGGADRLGCPQAAGSGRPGTGFPPMLGS